MTLTIVKGLFLSNLSCAASPALKLNEIQFVQEQIQIEKFKAESNEGHFSDPAGNLLILKADQFDESQARKVLKNRLIQLKLLFAPQTAAYPGMLTKSQDCKKSAKLPNKIETTGQFLSWWAELSAAEDLSYGSCGSKPEPYRSQYLLLYCKTSKKLFDIRYFKKGNTPDGRLKLNLPIAQCP